FAVMFTSSSNSFHSSSLTRLSAMATSSSCEVPIRSPENQRNLLVDFGAGDRIPYTRGWFPAWRYLAQSPQGRKAARVSELFRVRGESSRLGLVLPRAEEPDEPRDPVPAGLDHRRARRARDVPRGRPARTAGARPARRGA